MFTRDDANQLRASLEPLDFAAEAPASPVLDRYRRCYGLDFSSPTLPVRHAIGRFESDSFSLVCQHFALPLAQQRGTAFLLHGYFDHTGLYGHLIKHCLQQGLAVVMFDLPGHGLSSGAAASIDSFQRYTAALLTCLRLAAQQQLNQPWVSIGQSTGGAVLMDALLGKQLAQRYPLQRYILLAPLLRPYRWWQSRLLFALVRHFVRTTPRNFAANSHDQEFLSFIKSSDALQSQLLPRDWVQAMIDYQRRFAAAPTSAQALHIIQGSADKTVDWQYNLAAIQAKFPQSKSFLVADARHHLVNESAEYRTRVFSLLDQVMEGII